MPPVDRGPSVPAAKHLPLIAAGGVLAVVLGVGLVGAADEGSDAAAPSTVSAVASAPVVTSSLAGVVSSVEAPPSVDPLASALTMGSYGDDVVRVQQRLTDLGFQPGRIDGSFGAGTQQAVWAFKKLTENVTWDDFRQRQDQTTVSEATWQAMNDPSLSIQPRRPDTGRHIEIYLPLQVMALFGADNQPIFISHISTGQLNADGTDYTFCEDVTYDTDYNGNLLDEPVTKPICAEAKTPPGVFRLQRYHDGRRQSPLGGMKNPWYFNYGIAIHGAYNVPNRPDSHGCIRISNDLADVFPSLVQRGDAVFVWGYDGREPESYTERERRPSFNREDPTRTTTTTSTTTSTTVPPTTTSPAPATTKPPATTVKPPATTAPPTVTTSTVPPAESGGD